MVEPQSSKLMVRVRFPSSPPPCRRWSQRRHSHLWGRNTHPHAPQRGPKGRNSTGRVREVHAMSTAHTAFNVTDLYTGRSFTYVPGDGPSLAALFPEATDSTTYALETVTDALDAGYLPDT